MNKKRQITSRLALTTWGNRISPVLESAGTLMIVEIENQKIIRREFKTIDAHMINRLIAFLRHAGIDRLICGAVTTRQVSILKQNSIEFTAFIAGNTENVLDSILGNTIPLSNFLMPGNDS